MPRYFNQAPANCDLCSQPLLNVMFDCSVLPSGRWGCICSECFVTVKATLGLGRGQKYKQVDCPDSDIDHAWEKVEG